MMLGGSLAQIPSIKKAKEMGCYVITCDYLPNNPGHRFADEYHNVSTTDKEKILEIAKQLNIDGIVCYASDPAAPTAAYVAEKMNLSTSPYSSVDILCNKDKFREFLRKNNFNVPRFKVLQDNINTCNGLTYPLIVKPVDSSGSKGVSKVTKPEDLIKAVELAKRYSRCDTVIVEEYVESVYPPLAGDVFSVDGKLVFWAFADDYFDTKSLNPLAPIVETYPCSWTQSMQQKTISEINRLLSLLNMKTSAYNIEARCDSNGNVFLMEVAPRNGGNGIPEITKYATGIDMIEFTIKASLGIDCSKLCQKEINGFWSCYMLHSNISGKFLRIDIDETYEKNNMIDLRTDLKYGDIIKSFSGSDCALGTLLSRFSTYDEMMKKTRNLEQYVRIVVQ